MEDKHIDNFDLAILLRRGDLNIRRVAADNPNMTVGDYFKMLSDLIRYAPVFSENLRKLINRDGDRNIYKDLAVTLDLMKKLGYEKHAINFDGILDSYDRGHSRLMSAYARKVIDDFYDLCTQITDARIPQQPDGKEAYPIGMSLRDWAERQFTGTRREEEPSEKPVILAVDDSPVTLKSVSSYLGDDYKVYMLAKPYLLEKTLKQIRPDLFLLDYNMPILNGFDLIPIIRGLSDFRRTPIIFLTSEGTLDCVASAVKLGACDFIAKPVQPGVLRERVSKHLEKRNETEEYML